MRLNSLIGMNKIKEEINLMIKKHIVRHYDGYKNSDIYEGCNHILLVGKPGTGKTTVAEIISNIICAMGFLETDYVDEPQLTNPSRPGGIANSDFIDTINLICQVKLKDVEETRKKMVTIGCIANDIDQIVNESQDISPTIKLVSERINIMKRVLGEKIGGNKTNDINNMNYDIEPDFKPILVNVSREDLVSDHVGGTAPKTSAKIREAIGGVMFIDEAYSMMNKSGSGEVEGFSSESLTTICKMMEKYAKNFICIFAGYTEKTIEMLMSNEGLRRRITHTFVMDDYTHEDVAKIFVHQLNRANLTLHSSINIVKFIKKNEYILGLNGSMTGLLVPIIAARYSESRFDQIINGNCNDSDKGIVTSEIMNKSLSVFINSNKVWKQNNNNNDTAFRTMFG